MYIIKHGPSIVDLVFCVLIRPKISGGLKNVQTTEPNLSPSGHTPLKVPNVKFDFDVSLDSM